MASVQRRRSTVVAPSSTEKPFECYPRHPLNYYGVKGDELGKGNSGQVYLTTGGSHGQPVAIKQLNRWLDENKKEEDPTIWREVAFLTRLRHPNIPRILDVHRDEEYYYLVQEAPGRKPANKMNEQDVTDVVFTLAQVYAYLENERIIHADLKLDNILISPDNAYLIDFGIAFIYDETDLRNRTTITDEYYSIPYRAPELFMGMELFDNKTEIWALGGLSLVLLEIRPNFMKPGPIPTVIDTPQAEGSLMIESWQIDIAYLNKWQELLGPMIPAWPSVKYLPKAGYLNTLDTTHLSRKSILSQAKIDIATRELIEWMLTWDPAKRASAKDILGLFSAKYPRIPTRRECLRRRSRKITEPKNILIKSRNIAVDWMIELSTEEIGERLILTRTLFLAITLFDLYLAEKEVLRNQVQLYAIVAIYLACILNGDSILIKPLLYLAADQYNREQFHSGIDEMLTTLCYDLFQATAFDFVVELAPGIDFRLNLGYVRMAVHHGYSYYGKTPEEFVQSIINGDKQKLMELKNKTDNIPIVL